MASTTRFVRRVWLVFSLAVLVSAAGCVAEVHGAVAAKLRADYAVTRVGVNGFKFDYNHIVQPGTVLSVRILGIYADPANTPQAIINTVIVNGEAKQQRGLLSALSSTTQGHTLEKDEQVYVTRIDLREDSVFFELLTAGNAEPRYRAEVRFTIPNLGTMDAAAVEQVIGRALAGGPVAGSGGVGGAEQAAAASGWASGSGARSGGWGGEPAIAAGGGGDLGGAGGEDSGAGGACAGGFEQRGNGGGGYAAGLYRDGVLH